MLGMPDAALFIMLSSGGTATVDTARRFPIRLVESGPAAGALAASYYGTLTGRPNLLSFDMGGTTAKACIIDNGEPLISPDFEVARVYRFKRGSGLPVRVPVIEMIEIGAGGGSIARVDSLGLLKVGPDSAGAEPGPACYGRGGTLPTVTDADLILGYLDPGFFLGGPLAFVYVRSYPAPLADLDWARVDGLLNEMAEEGTATLTASGVPRSAVTVRRSADLRYRGQGHEVAVPIPDGSLTAASLP